MPREVIQSYESNPDAQLPALSIGWGKDYPDIEVMSFLDPGTAKEHYLRTLSGQTQVRLTQEQVEQLADLLTEPHSGALGWCSRHNRHAVNRMIRILRKARDQAFGADA